MKNDIYLLRVGYEVDFKDDHHESNYHMELYVNDPSDEDNPHIVPIDVEDLFSNNRDGVIVNVNSNLRDHHGTGGQLLSSSQADVIMQFVKFQEQLTDNGNSQ